MQHTCERPRVEHTFLVHLIEDKLHEQFINICDMALKGQVANEDLARWIISELLSSMDRIPSLYDSRKRPTLLKLTSFFQRLDAAWPAERLLDKLAKMWDSGKLSAAENSCPELAKSMIGTSKQINHMLQRVCDTNFQSSEMLGTLAVHPCIRAVLGHSPGTTSAVLNNPDIPHMQLGLFGWQALHLAATLGATSVVTSLLGARMDVDAPDNYGRTALFLAAAYGHHECCDVLRMANANINARDCNNHHILELAARGGHMKVVELLINFGAHVNPAFLSPCASTPLQAAFESFEINSQMVNYLLSRGASPGARRGCDGKTAINLAEARQEYVFVELMNQINEGSYLPNQPFDWNNHVTHEIQSINMTS